MRPGMTLPRWGSRNLTPNQKSFRNGREKAAKPPWSSKDLVVPQRSCLECSSQISKTQENILSLVSWNSRSINNLQKLANVSKYDSDIVCLQECWNPKDYILNQIENKFVLNSRVINQGGGTLTWTKPSFTITKSVLIGDSSLLRINVTSEITFWLANCYIQKKNKLETLNLFKLIQRNIPTPQWKYLILVGDLNIDLNAAEDGTTKTLKSVIKQMGLSFCNIGPTRLDCTLDIIAYGTAFSDFQVNHYPSFSDHALIHCLFKINKAKVSDMKLKIPNRKAADKITLDALKNSTNATSFLKNVVDKMKERHFNIMKETKIKLRKSELMERIFSVEREDEDIGQLISNYWNEMNTNIEKYRYSKESKDAFNLMKRIYKYHQLDRKDGSIVNRILMPSGELVDNQTEVAKILIDGLKELQSTSTEPQYSEPLSFPELPPVTDVECRSIIENISTNKALAFDGVSDVMFNQENINLSSAILRDIWNTDWNQIPEAGMFFKSRLIPLNKSHPHIPGPKDFRPIVVASPMIKLLEARLLPKIRDYLKKSLYRGQIGFTPGLGTSVNIFRLAQKYANLSTKKEKGYALFLDFRSAYNKVLHSKLYKRLEKVLSVEEIQLIKAIYSRQSISMNNEQFTPNCGVAQGSLISPGLFNIYVEPLYKKIENQGVSSDSIMAYADDLLVICSSLNQLQKVIQTVKQWCKKNNFELNEKKSGIVELLPRKGPFRRQFKDEDMLEGINFTSKYKYLGTWISNKLTLDSQMEFIKMKTDILASKLFPLLHDVSLSLRINLWEIFIKPLFDQIVHLFRADPAKTNRLKAMRLFKYTFKRFTLLSKNTPDKLIEFLSGFTLEGRAERIFQRDQYRWETRTGEGSKGLSLSISQPDKCKALLPKEFQIFINISSSPCKLHGSTILTPEHLQNYHGISIPNYYLILKQIEKMAVYKVTFRGGKIKKTINRFASLKVASEYLKIWIALLKRVSYLNYI